MRRLPVYILVDTSGSMRGEPINAVNSGLQAMLSAMRQDPYALETIWLSIITFDVEAREYLPLPPLAKAVLEEIEDPNAGATFLGAALKLLLICVERDVKKATADLKGDWRPLLCVVTDGSPSDLQAYRDAIRQIRKLNLAAIIVCAVGPKAKVEILRELADRVVAVDVAALASFFQYTGHNIGLIGFGDMEAPASDGSSSLGVRDEIYLPPPPNEVRIVI